MRTTLTIDDDVAVQIERLRKERDVALKELVNDALRRGLRDMSAPPRKSKPFRTKSFDAGPPLIDNVDNIAEVLAIIEGEAYR
ncbi:MAG TPA: CopG family transcriptional regulator [Propylenella sp.]